MNAIFFPTLNSERLILRAFTIDDAKDVHRLAGDKLIADTTLLIPHPYPDGAAEQWIETHNELFLRGTDYIFAITEKTSAELIGAIGLTVNISIRIGELGYWIGVPFWNKGYCTEAVGKLLEFGFEELKLNKIHAHHFINNPASGHVLLKSGMKLEGTLKQHVMKDGRHLDIRTYGIVKEDYEKSDYGKTGGDGFYIDQMDHVELFVPDRFEAAVWYEKVLGLKIVGDYRHWSENPKGPLMISPDGGNTKIALFTGQPQAEMSISGFYLAAFRTSGSSFMKFLDRIDNDIELYNHNGEKVTSDAVADHDKAFSIYFNDPYGNRLELTTYEHEYVQKKLK